MGREHGQAGSADAVPATPVHVVYVLGAAHSGSTLLNLLLNGHPQLVGLSEVAALPDYVRDPDSRPDQPLMSPFWQRVRGCWEERAREPFSGLEVATPTYREQRRWGPRRTCEYRTHNLLLLECVSEIAGADIIVDSSKHWRRLALLADVEGLCFRVIHLVRDGRGVVNSLLRKHGSFRRAFREWASAAVGALRARRSSDYRGWLQVHYEDLATDPEEALRRICAFLEVPFVPEMLRYRTHPYYGVGGNRMRLQDDEVIELDDSWREELSRWDRWRFALLGGWLNALYGYR